MTQAIGRLRPPEIPASTRADGDDADDGSGDRHRKRQDEDLYQGGPPRGAAFGRVLALEETAWPGRGRLAAGRRHRAEPFHTHAATAAIRSEGGDKPDGLEVPVWIDRSGRLRRLQPVDGADQFRPVQTGEADAEGVGGGAPLGAGFKLELAAVGQDQAGSLSL